MLGLLARAHEPHQAVVEVGGVDTPGHPARRALQEGGHRNLRAGGAVFVVDNDYLQPPPTAGAGRGWTGGRGPPWW